MCVFIGGNCRGNRGWHTLQRKHSHTSVTKNIHQGTLKGPSKKGGARKTTVEASGKPCTRVYTALFSHFSLFASHSITSLRPSPSFSLFPLLRVMCVCGPFSPFVIVVNCAVHVCTNEKTKNTHTFSPAIHHQTRTAHLRRRLGHKLHTTR